MLRLPRTGSAVRSMIDLEFLASLGSVENQRQLPTFQQALLGRRREIREQRGVRSIDGYVLRADGELWLVRVRANSWTCLWNFGRLCNY